MKEQPRLRLEPRPSWLGRALIVAACAATSVLLGWLPLPVAAVVPAGAAVLAVLLSGLRQCTRRGTPAMLDVGIDRRISVTDREGRSRSGAILDDSYVGAWLTTVIWRADEDAWWRQARVILILPDSLPPDDFRRLRVALRYGRPAGGEGTSGADAG